MIYQQLSNVTLGLRLRYENVGGHNLWTITERSGDGYVPLFMTGDAGIANAMYYALCKLKVLENTR